MAVPVARGVTPAGVTLGLRRLAWLIEARGLANRSEGLGAGLAWALSIKVRGWGAGLAFGLLLIAIGGGLIFKSALIHAKADVNATSDEGKTALHYACANQAGNNNSVAVCEEHLLRALLC